MRQYVGDHLSYPARIQQSLLGSNREHFLFPNPLPRFKGVHVVNTKRQHILVTDRIGNGVRMQAVTKNLRSGADCQGRTRSLIFIK